MLQRIVFFTCAIAVALAWLNLAAAQDSPGPMSQIQVRIEGPGMMILGMLKNEKCQKELELTDEQKSKIDEFDKSVHGDINKELSEARPTTAEEFQRVIKDIGDKANARVVTELKDILQPKQMERLKQLRVRAVGARSLLEKETATELNLTEDQTAKLKEVMSDANKAAVELLGGPTATPEERQAKAAEHKDGMLKIAQELETNLLNVLTPEQRDQFKKMQGEPAK